MCCPPALCSRLPSPRLAAVRGDLIRVLGKLLKRKNKFDAILIETTGLADPAPVAQTFFVDDELKESLRLDAILTVVDAKHVLLHLDEEREDGSVNESIQQVRGGAGGTAGRGVAGGRAAASYQHWAQTNQSSGATKAALMTSIR